jgi:hypothetical protein
MVKSLIKILSILVSTWKTINNFMKDAWLIGLQVHKTEIRTEKDIQNLKDRKHGSRQNKIYKLKEFGFLFDITRQTSPLFFNSFVDYLCSDFRSVPLYPQLFVGGSMSYLRYLCLLAHSGVQLNPYCVFRLSSSCVSYTASFSYYRTSSRQGPLN